eukprot:UN34635
MSCSSEEKKTETKKDTDTDTKELSVTENEKGEQKIDPKRIQREDSVQSDDSDQAKNKWSQLGDIDDLRIACGFPEMVMPQRDEKDVPKEIQEQTNQSGTFDQELDWYYQDEFGKQGPVNKT